MSSIQPAHSRPKVQRWLNAAIKSSTFVRDVWKLTQGNTNRVMWPELSGALWSPTSQLDSLLSQSSSWSCYCNKKTLVPCGTRTQDNKNNKNHQVLIVPLLLDYLRGVACSVFLQECGKKLKVILIILPNCQKLVHAFLYKYHHLFWLYFIGGYIKWCKQL